MFCRNCGKEVNAQAAACPGCGVPPLQAKKYCSNCAAPTQENQVMCTKCGATLASKASGEGKSKVAAGLLGIFLGSLGIHKFYLGYNKEGVIMLLVSVLGGACTCGVASAAVSVVGLIEGILYLTKSDGEFDRIYVQNRKGWF